MGKYVMVGDRPVTDETPDPKTVAHSGVREKKFVMVGDRVVATEDETAPEKPAETVQTVFYCNYCIPNPRPFSSEHALKVHVGKAHPAQRARVDYEASVKERQAENEAVAAKE